MPLLELWNATPHQFDGYRVWQIVSFSGDGRLKDNSEASAEFRKFLGLQPSERLFRYTEDCLQERFQDSGLVLQDIVNELGKRLGYSVVSGVYRGRKGTIGYDGIWRLPGGQALVVEVKTTDAYRINLDTLAQYRDRLIERSEVGSRSPILIVVGRQDTGDLEAQIRGSRHAWYVRLISAKALSRLVSLRESSDGAAAEKIRSLLVPRAYTRLDDLIDVLIHTAEDTRRSMVRGSRLNVYRIDHRRSGDDREGTVYPHRIKSISG